MKYCYCPNCDYLRPKSWFLRSRCEVCQGECVQFDVKRSIFGILMYLCYALSGILIALYVGNFLWHAGWASIISSVPQNTVLIIIIVFFITGLVFSFIDIGRTNAEAEKVKNGLKQVKTIRNSP